jgi:3-dehydroquinate synthase
MVAASRAAVLLGMLDGASCARIVHLIGAAGLPTSGMKQDVEQVMQTMLTDKKVRNGKVRFILPERIGQVIVRDDVPPDIIREALLTLR